jgi:hypothetical protein
MFNLTIMNQNERGFLDTHAMSPQAADPAISYTEIASSHCCRPSPPQFFWQKTENSGMGPVALRCGNLEPRMAEMGQGRRSRLCRHPAYDRSSPKPDHDSEASPSVAKRHKPTHAPQQPATARAFDLHVSAQHTVAFRNSLQPFIGAPYDERAYTVHP